MKSIFNELLQKASLIENDAEKLIFLTSVLRSVQQTAVIVTFELANARVPIDEINLFEDIQRFGQPSDGLPLDILDNLVPNMRHFLSANFLNGWFEKVDLVDEPLSAQLKPWVEFRNRRQSHGVLDSGLTREWSNKVEKIIKNCLVVFDEILPVVDDSSEEMLLSRKYDRLKIKTPLLFKKHAIVFLNISAKKSIWSVHGQMLSQTNAEEFKILLEEKNIFLNVGQKPCLKYELVDVFLKNGEEKSLFHNLPIRQTAIFEGRAVELQSLREWLDDVDSRYCLVYGDGGYGKTTLVLEFFNQLLEGEFYFERPLPEIISYYTAKKTKWTESGLTHFTSISPVVDECLRELVRCIESVLSKKWYLIEGKALIDRVKTVLVDEGYSRDDILLVIDNTETLATSSSEVKELGSFFKKLGKLIGRVVITSRRREFIEASPILIEGLNDDECISLMRRLAEESGAQSIGQAGEPKLRQVSHQLMNKPLLLEALVRYISATGLGIEEAIKNVFKKTSEELLNFLYDDAWRRMNDLQKKVFLTIIHLTVPLDQNSISETCKNLKIQHSEFLTALEETHFSMMTDRGKSYSLVLVELASNFFEMKFQNLSGDEQSQIKLLALKTDEYSKNLDKVLREYERDRVSEAFRSEFAKAAKVAADRGDINEAIEMYELAIVDDPINSSLYDRFSWLLLNKKHDYEYAKTISLEAFKIDKNNCDAVVGLALVFYRLENLAQGDFYIDLAGNLGRPKSFCLLRKAIAKYHFSSKILNHAEKRTLLDEALREIKQALSIKSNKGGYEAKNLNDMRKYEELIYSKMALLRPS